MIRDPQTFPTSFAPGRSTWKWAARLGAFALVALAGAPGPIARASESSELALLPAPGTTPPRLVRRMPVHYPQHLREQGAGGVVIVGARVGRDGRVRETRIEHSVSGLDETALAIAARYEFTPARRGDDEVECWVLVPLRFEATAPPGARGTEPVEASPYSDVDRSFESDVAVLQQNEPAAPSEADAELRRRIMSGSLLLEVLPPPGIEAVRALQQGDSLVRATAPALVERRKASWQRAAHLAPWWPLPYRRLAATAVAERDFGVAARCLDILVAGRPDDEWAIAMRKRARQLQGADATRN